ncbi:hypothetical protein DENSPDRAFT_845004 [Dentipellis sp. KUC8613]|nr:hypothetical protein DENSPDRAFT_845004 [Dentipellis sp. KUC8613]
MLSLFAKRGALPLRVPTASARTFTYSSTRQLAARKSADGSDAAGKKPKAASTTKPKKEKEKKEKKEKKPQPLKLTREQMPPPRAHPNSYSLFVREQIPKFERPASGNVMATLFKEIADKWRGMSESEKKVYHERFVEENKAVRERYDTWLKEVDPEVLKAINAKRKKSGKPRIRKENPNPRPNNSYMLFANDVRPEYPREAQPKDSSDKYFIWTMKQIGERWRALSPAERDVYQKRWEEARAAHQQTKDAP